MNVFAPSARPTAPGELLLDPDAGQSMRLLRWSKGVSLHQCAGALGLTLREFLRKELGRECFTAREVAILADMLEATPRGLVQHVFPKCEPAGGPDEAGRH